jgi:hypothetical protein
MFSYNALVTDYAFAATLSGPVRNEFYSTTLRSPTFTLPSAACLSFKAQVLAETLEIKVKLHSLHNYPLMKLCTT